MRYLVILFFLGLTWTSCDWYRQKPDSQVTRADTAEIIQAAVIEPQPSDTSSKINEQWDYKKTGQQKIDTKNVTADELVTYAKTLMGVPYRYASSNPETGFDCSGFITFVFNHFDIAVPRSSVDFTTVERPIEIKEARAGDLILFTGTDSTVRTVGHMGIIVSKQGEPVSFIHSTSGRDYGVTITPLNPYYQGRFAGVRRVFE